MKSAFLAVLLRDLRLAARRPASVVSLVAFFAVAASLFPLAIGPEPEILARIAPGALWIAALMAAMLSLDRLFAADYADGSLDALMLAPAPLEVIALAKCAAHWLTGGALLTAAAPVLALALQLGPEGAAALALSLLLGAPTLSLVGAVGAALALGARRGGALVPLLVLPLAVPVLIFGAAAAERAAHGESAAAPFMALGALLLAALVLAPPAIAAALRAAAE